MMGRVGESGFQGVHWRARNQKYEASCTIDGKRYYLGMYDDILDAGVAASDFRLQHAAEISVTERMRTQRQARAQRRAKRKRRNARGGQ